MEPIEEFNRASVLLSQGEYENAAALFFAIRKKNPALSPLCDYQLAIVANAQGDPMMAYKLYYNAFTRMPNLTSVLYVDKHFSKNYIFTGKRDEQERTSCPLCGNTDITPKWCYPLPEAVGYNSFFNPIRLWMYCKPCHHVFARHFPEKLFIYNDSPRSPQPSFFSYYSDVLGRISQYASGMKLFEVGIGACECLLAAREIGFDAFGIDVIDKHVRMAREKYGLNAETADFVEYETGDRFDVIIMGDVLEHVSDPVLAMNKAAELLKDDGALWVSTPNFDSAFSIVSGHGDGMKRQQYHVNYFSRDSFYFLLNKCGLIPVDYTISERYNGSMEVVAVKNR